MAFAKGRAFVILNRMAESGDSEAKKILSNLNSMSQEDLDSKLSTLFGKGGASKEGDTAPKDEKGSKAPEGKEEAPKGTKEPKEGKVVANKDFDPNKEGVQSIFGTEEENAKSKDKQVFNTMEEVAKPKEMTSAKDGIKPVEVAPIQENKDFNKKGLFGVDNIGGGNKDYLGKRKFMTEPNSGVQREIDNVMLSSENNEEKLSGIAALREKYEGNKVNLAALDKLEQEINDNTAKEKELYDFVGSAEKEMPELSSYLAEFETYIDNDDILTMQGFVEYLDAQSENVEDTPEKNAEVREVKAFVDGKLGRGQATPSIATQPSSQELSKKYGGTTGSADSEKALAQFKKDYPEQYKKTFDRLLPTWGDAAEVNGAMEMNIQKGNWDVFFKEETPKGSASNPMTNATEGIKPVEAPKSNDPLKQGKNGFVAFYKGKTYEVFGDSKYEAQQKLAKALGVKKAYDIALELAEQDGKQVKITPDF
jgi:hypothetical protein